MNPVLWAALGFVAGLVVMWLALRFLTIRQLQARDESMTSQITNLERERQKSREEASKFESRLEYREREVTELKERVTKLDSQVRASDQAKLAAETQVRSMENARDDLERALTRLEQQVKERDAQIAGLQQAAQQADSARQAQGQALNDLRSQMVQGERQSAELSQQLAAAQKELAESQEIIASLRGNLRAEGNDAMGLRQAVKRQQAEINNLRLKLNDVTGQLSVRNERLAQLQKTLSERKQTIVELRRRLDQATRGAAGAGDAAPAAAQRLAHETELELDAAEESLESAPEPAADETPPSPLVVEELLAAEVEAPETVAGETGDTAEEPDAEQQESVGQT